MAKVIRFLGDFYTWIFGDLYCKEKVEIGCKDRGEKGGEVVRGMGRFFMRGHRQENSKEFLRYYIERLVENKIDSILLSEL